ncbi:MULTISPECIES: hypothetical protein [Planktothrix]|uniref:XRE family transcriptional regulator n=1 Tax=Planktothrix mougeotii LEGE 06226 TaxID=1828728 RepID=A0ABR9UE51_9CYAN|nr:MULTISPECIES: hypothetical protein [Planktothrix]MBD2485323.1 hypothetical protein [Planktothrix sp. FACHB-1365]MBE9144744.1 hypothetical protein [Planktothrix mougeotii LEGE 06226]
MLRQSDVARILGVSHQRVSQLRLRHRIEFAWDEDLRTWVTTPEEVEHFLECRAKRSALVYHQEPSLSIVRSTRE